MEFVLAETRPTPIPSCPRAWWTRIVPGSAVLPRCVGARSARAGPTSQHTGGAAESLGDVELFEADLPVGVWRVILGRGDARLEHVPRHQRQRLQAIGLSVLGRSRERALLPSSFFRWSANVEDVGGEQVRDDVT